MSDDTQLTLATCEAIIEHASPDPDTIARSLVSWFSRGKITGIGSSTLKALLELQAGNHWALSGARGERAAGNGAAMRIAPIAFFLDPTVDDDRQSIRDICRITHHSDEAYTGALAVLSAVRAAATGEWRGEATLLEIVVDLLPDTRVRDVLEELRTVGEMAIAEVARRYGQSGYVAESVPLALFAAQSTRQLGFKAVLTQVVEAGGDTDTIAAMTGSIAGTLLGDQGLPSDWFDVLPALSQIESAAHHISRLLDRKERL